MARYICITCGTQYPASDMPPAECPICMDDRQYINQQGQQWTTLAQLQEQHSNEFTDVEPGLLGIRSVPGFAIGQQVYLIQSPAGNVLFDCISLLDDATIAHVRRLGGIAAIAIS